MSASGAQCRLKRSSVVKTSARQAGGFAVGRRADAAPAVIGRIGGDEVEPRRGPQGEGGESFVQFHPRVLHVPFNLIARWIFREDARRHGQRAAAAGVCERKRQRRRREGRDSQSGIALRTESTSSFCSAGG